jgi:hypothetical protein
MGGTCSKYGTGYWWEDLMERDHLEDLSVDGSIILKLVSTNGMGAWIEFIWIRIGIGDGRM